MALIQQKDSIGRDIWVDPLSKRAFTEGGKRDTYYTIDQWNKRQTNKTPQPVQTQNNNTRAYQQTNNSFSDYQKQFEKASAPVVQSLQNQQTKLQDQYKQLIDQIKGQQTVAEQGQTKVTAGELAKRGISGDSTLAQQEIQSALQPIQSNYAGVIGQAGRDQAAQEADIASKIAGIQSNNTTNAIDYAIRMKQLNDAKAQQDYQNSFEANKYQDLLKQQAFENQMSSQKQQNSSGSDGNLLDFLKLFQGNNQVSNSPLSNILGYQYLPQNISGPPVPVYSNGQKQSVRLPSSFSFD